MKLPDNKTQLTARHHNTVYKHLGSKTIYLEIKGTRKFSKIGDCEPKDSNNPLSFAGVQREAGGVRDCGKGSEKMSDCIDTRISAQSRVQLLSSCVNSVHST